MPGLHRQSIGVPGLSRLSAILFDMDGVLIDSREAWVEVLTRCRHRRGMAALSEQQFRAGWGQGISADCESWFPGESAAALALEYDQLFAEQIHLVRRVDGIVSLLDAVAMRGWRRAVVTNSPRRVAESALVATGLLSYFDTLATGDEVVRGKPDPALVRLALSRLAVEPNDVVMVGDTHLDVDAGRAAGVFVIGLNTPGDASIGHLSELTALLK